VELGEPFWHNITAFVIGLLAKRKSTKEAGRSLKDRLAKRPRKNASGLPGFRGRKNVLLGEPDRPAHWEPFLEKVV
jgi:hypothetical protein